MADEVKTPEVVAPVAVAAPTVSQSEEEKISIWKQNDHSTLLGVSVRGWIAMIVIGTVCFMSIRDITVKEPLYTLAGLVTGFYFGANTNPKK